MGNHAIKHEKRFKPLIFQPLKTRSRYRMPINPASKRNPAQTQQARQAKTIGKAFPWCQTPKKAKQTQQGKAQQGKKNPARPG
jgi:hypothetical protein